jgi:hypothetical protein
MDRATKCSLAESGDLGQRLDPGSGKIQALGGLSTIRSAKLGKYL